MEQLKRKNNRIKDYDYSQNGAYFITICTMNRKSLFWSVGETIGLPNETPHLSDIGLITNTAIEDIPIHYAGIKIDKYVIMPNHVHFILLITGDSMAGGRAMHAPTVSEVITQMKGVVTKQAGFPVWQRSFHDHIIRNEKDYLEIWNYIDTNPSKWAADKYYDKEEVWRRDDM